MLMQRHFSISLNTYDKERFYLESRSLSVMPLAGTKLARKPDMSGL